MKEIDVLIYFEHVVRELDSCLLLKYNLEQLGLTAELATIHCNRYVTFIKYKPKVVVVPFLFVNKHDIILQEFKSMYGNVVFLNLHHEQFYNEMTKSHFMPQNNESRNAYHLSWGKHFANDLIEFGVDKDKIIYAGNPRTDTFYLKPIDEFLNLKKTYENLIFIPTSFSWAFVSEDYFINNAKIDPDVFKEKRAITLATAELYFKHIRFLAQKYPKNIFILRPHPFEEIETYVYYLKKVDSEKELESNICIVREGNVYDWLQICDLMIGWITTVSMEASSFKKKNIIYTPILLDDTTKTDFMKLYDNIISDLHSLDNIIANIQTYNPANTKVQEYIEESMGNVDGKVNYRIALAIHDIIQKGVGKQVISIRYFYNVFRSLFIDFPKNILLKLNLLGKFIPLYNGVIEDMLSYKQISNAYLKIKKRINISISI